MDRYLDDGKDINMAWAITYLIKLFERGSGLDCSTFEQDVSDFFASLSTTQGWIDWVNPLKAVAGGGRLVIRPEILEALKN